MTRLLLIIATISIFFSCKKNSVEPAPQTSTTSTPINYLPKMVISTESNISGFMVHQFKYNSNNLVENIIKYNLLYWPTIIDSITLSYNSNNQVIKKEYYNNNVLYEEKHFTYTPSGKSDKINIITPSGSIQYLYHYNILNEVDYVLGFENENSQVLDSITLNGNSVTSYRYRVGIDPDEILQNGFLVWGTNTYYPTSNGIYHSIPTCLNLSIDFQNEVAECFLEMGETGFPNKNYFQIPSPRKYASIANGKTFSYTFDQNNRLTKIDGEFANFSSSGAQIPGTISKTIYY